MIRSWSVKTKRGRKIQRWVVVCAPEQDIAVLGLCHYSCFVTHRPRCAPKHLLDRTAKRVMVHSWPFAQLLDFIRYKAALAGVQVIEEDLRHTSQHGLAPDGGECHSSLTPISDATCPPRGPFLAKIQILAPFKFQLTVFRQSSARHELSPQKLSTTFALF